MQKNLLCRTKPSTQALNPKLASTVFTTFQRESEAEDMNSSQRGVEPSLELLVNHPIFAGTSTGALDPQAEPSQSTPKLEGLKSLLCVRDADVVAAVGSELRMMPMPTKATTRFNYKVRRRPSHRVRV